MADAALRVVVAEDSFLMRESLSRLLSADERLLVVGLGEDFDTTLRLVDQHRPDVLITDVRMPPTGSDEGVRLANHFRDSHPDLGVVVLSQYDDPGYAMALVAGGCRGRAYLLKERIAELEPLIEAVCSVARGGSVLDPAVIDGLITARTATGQARLDRLTPRERQVLAALATGASNRMLAQRLVLSQRAVEKHINAIFAKLGLTGDVGIDQRVKATLMYLSGPADQATVPSWPRSFDSAI